VPTKAPLALADGQNVRPMVCSDADFYSFLRPRLSYVVKQVSGRNAMKKLEAIIQPFKLDDVKEALKAIGIDGMTITEVRGHGRQKGHKEVYRGQEYNVDLLPKVKVELVVANDRADEVIKTLTAAARTGKIGDGKLFVYDVAQAIRIRNDDRGDAAL
jgi:nitrogen regulatory protein P-II 1